ncbi:MAG: hypothetical protein A2161_14860 [Candidatus Schekmanbacteria bacterium RBG_13_48_7]|uniref:NAD-dependent epimerase/dehydratase domain-containing protein n=1 Tax=Candidatus Schekmanbacteria bacterium RBG_13_48_7 TaxID=1817878 RepID=A0A1F7RXM5_9BACT|nr:MAG: hypothetical protein A2161_14860 [Candidatus Schekmanbacteria bacterium RBG_13_48_7]
MSSIDTNKTKENESVSKVLVTGGAGYIGCHLIRILLERGCKVRVLDSFLFDQHSLDNLKDNPNLEIMVGDIRHMEELASSLEGVSSVIHLAGIVGDPACNLEKQVTLSINYEATRLLVDLCKYNNIKRLVFASTCSVYGARGEEILTEESPISPISLYAETKIRSEEILLKAANENSLEPVIVRFATVYGLSRRMRFDLVLNILTAKAVHEKKIRIYGGVQWRPLIHAKDAAAALMLCLEASGDVVCGEIFNAGSNQENYRIKDLEKIFVKLFPRINIEHVPPMNDERSYNVSFDKITSVLGFTPQETAKRGVKELKDSLLKGNFADYLADKYYNVKYLYK